MIRKENGTIEVPIEEINLPEPDYLGPLSQVQVNHGRIGFLTISGIPESDEIYLIAKTKGYIRNERLNLSDREEAVFFIIHGKRPVEELPENVRLHVGKVISLREASVLGISRVYDGSQKSFDIFYETQTSQGKQLKLFVPGRDEETPQAINITDGIVIDLEKLL